MIESHSLRGRTMKRLLSKLIITTVGTLISTAILASGGAVGSSPTSDATNNPMGASSPSNDTPSNPVSATDPSTVNPTNSPVTGTTTKVPCDPTIQSGSQTGATPANPTTPTTSQPVTPQPVTPATPSSTMTPSNNPADSKY